VPRDGGCALVVERLPRLGRVLYLEVLAFLACPGEADACPGEAEACPGEAVEGPGVALPCCACRGDARSFGRQAEFVASAQSWWFVGRFCWFWDY
jgi:hypothetical protein